MHSPQPTSIALACTTSNINFFLIFTTVDLLLLLLLLLNKEKDL